MQIYCKSKEYNLRKIKMWYLVDWKDFFYEIEDKYDLGRNVKVYPKFFTDQCYKRKWRLNA